MPIDAVLIGAAPVAAPGCAAPADLPPGRRGLRGRLAAAAALLALVALSTSWWHGHGSGGVSAGGVGVDYTFNGWRSWAPLAFTLVAGSLLAGAAVLWTARRAWGIALGGAIVLAAVGVGAWAAVIGQRFATVSAVEYQLAVLGTPRGQLEQLLGAPLSSDATASAPGLACDVYKTSDESGDGLAAFCFRNGVLALKVRQQGGAP